MSERKQPDRTIVRTDGRSRASKSDNEGTHV